MSGVLDSQALETQITENTEQARIQLLGIFVVLLVRWLVGWLHGRSVGWSNGWLVSWLLRQPFGCSVGRLVGQLVGQWVGLLVGLSITRTHQDLMPLKCSAFLLKTHHIRWKNWKNHLKL